MDKVVNLYSRKDTQLVSSKNERSKIELPAITFCFKPMMKPSIRNTYNISSAFCGNPESIIDNELNILKDINMTRNEFCTNSSLQINRDFTIHLMKTKNHQPLNEIELKSGYNNFDGEWVEVREVLTKFNGLCNILLTNSTFNTSINYFFTMSNFVLL